jgi:hypothetical protein
MQSIESDICVSEWMDVVDNNHLFKIFHTQLSSLVIEASTEETDAIDMVHARNRTY